MYSEVAGGTPATPFRNVAKKALAGVAAPWAAICDAKFPSTGSADPAGIVALFAARKNLHLIHLLTLTLLRMHPQFAEFVAPPHCWPPPELCPLESI